VNIVPVLDQLSTTLWTQMRERLYSSTVLELCTRWTWVVSFTPWLLYLLRKNPWYHWIWGFIGPRTCLDLVEQKKKKSLTPARNRIPAAQPVAIPTEPYRIRNSSEQRVRAQGISMQFIASRIDAMGTPGGGGDKQHPVMCPRPEGVPGWSRNWKRQLNTIVSIIKKI
jgi:hypothetical protein